ncbi:MAG: 3'-5' exonuclease [Azonexus sp.]|nr:3'-5' exonuclease [Azonexus sp.]MDZ4315024.1 3'-5' exonuclease [Azonexus sp.]
MSDVVMTRAGLGSADLPVYAGIPLDRISLIISDGLAEEALSALLAADAIGFDTESKPTFLKGEVSTGPHLVQLATDSQAYLFPVSRHFETPVLKTILESPTVLKIGFGLGNDHSVLQSRLGIAACNVLDLGEKLRGPGHRGTVGAKVAVAHFFGQKLQKSKKIGTSNWANGRLSERQLLYAANDAHVALKLYRAWLVTQHPVD